MKLRCPPGCHKCCELFTFVNRSDIERWTDDDRTDIMACLTWQRIHGRIPEDILFIPQKRHIVGHSLLKKYYRDEWGKDNTCIFLGKGGCSIYKTRPQACRDFPRGRLSFQCPGLEDVTELDRGDEKTMARERLKSNLWVYRNREIISKVIKKSKGQADVKRLAKLFGFIKENNKIL